MKLSGFSRSGRAVMAALLVAAAAGGVAAPANADRTDDNFIALLDARGVPYGSAGEAIRAAKEYCLASTRQSSPKLNGRGTPAASASQQLSLDMGWTATETQEFIRAARPAYCP